MYKRTIGVILASTMLLLISLCFDPRILLADPNDTRYSKPHLKNTVEYSVLLFGIFTLFSVIFYKYQNTSEEIRMITGLGFVAALLLTNGITENIKKMLGRLRPDFLARCRPDRSGVCTGDRRKIIEGRKSFPSGHTSTTFCAVFFMIYLLYMHGLNPILFLICSAFFLIFGLFVGLSRVSDNRHFPADVIGGIATGILCTCVTILLMHRNMKERIDSSSYRM